jgi:hypothetical protein
MDRTEQKYAMKFLFMDRRKDKAIQTELSRILKGQAVSVDVCKYWCRKFKAGDFSMDDLVRPGRPPIELSGAIMSLLSDEPFLSARVLAVRLSSTPGILVRGSRLHTSVSGWRICVSSPSFSRSRFAFKKWMKERIKKSSDVSVIQWTAAHFSSVLSALRADRTWHPLRLSPDFFGKVLVSDSARFSVCSKEIPVARHPPLFHIMQTAAIPFAE